MLLLYRCHFRETVACRLVVSFFIKKFNFIPSLLPGSGSGVCIRLHRSIDHPVIQVYGIMYVCVCIYVFTTMMARTSLASFPFGVARIRHLDWGSKMCHRPMDTSFVFRKCNSDLRCNIRHNESTPVAFRCRFVPVFSLGSEVWREQCERRVSSRDLVCFCDDRRRY